ncbi:MAG: hypothetical protein HY551_01400 [Elusimicrobia bacterium]|nr:hypothetical protein [Elusimicrobiota bacterium]
MKGNYGWGLPVAASTFAGPIDFGIKLIHAAMFAIFILWAIFFAYLLLRYRRREGRSAQAGYESPLKSLIPDFFVLVFEIALIVFYAIPNWHRIKIAGPSPDTALVVELVAEQFAWNFQYPGPDGKFGRRDVQFIEPANPIGLDPQDPAGKDDITTVNELHVPLGKPTILNMSSKDVIHSFFVPEFRVKQDIVPGMKISLWFEPTLAGRFEIGCAQLCGVAHSMMRGDAYVHTPSEYEAWLKAQSGQAPATTAANAATGNSNGSSTF